MNHSKKLALMSTLAGVAISLIGCGSNAPTTTPSTTPSNDPGVILPPRGRPNLRIGLFEATVRADGTIKVDVEVANTGLGPARTNSSTRVLHILESGRGNVVLDLATPPIGAGRSAKLTGVIPVGQVPFSRNTVLRVRADSGRGLDEGIAGEKDNFLDKEFVYGPDLAIGGIAKAPESIKNPKNLNLSAILINPGNVNTGAFSAVWEYSAKSAPVGTVDEKVLPKWEPLEKAAIGSIPPGRSAPEIKLAVDSAKAKSLNLNGKNVVFRLTLDPDRTINDLTPNNNSRGAFHAFPPDLPDINVLGLLAWWNNREPVVHLYPLIANTGDAVCPPFESQWFRLPGQGASTAQGNQTGGSGGAGNWQPLSPVLNHGAIQPMTWEFDPKNNTKVPEFAWTPDVKDEGELVVLKFEADLGNKVPEFTDTTAAASTPATTSTTATNGANNSFVWNFLVPRLPRSDLSVRSLRARLSPDKTRILIETAFSNEGSIHSGPFKLVASVNSAQLELNSQGIPPTSRLFRLNMIAQVTNQMRATGRATISVKLVGTKQEKDEKDNQLVRTLSVPRDRDPADIWVLEPSIRFLRSGRDKENPNRIDQAQVRYVLFNTGDEPTGKFSVNIGIEGGPGARIEDEDGIPGNSITVRYSEPLDIANMAKPVGYAKVQATVTAECEADANKDNNSRPTNVIWLAPRPPEKPVGRPDLHVASIGLRPTSTPQNVHLKTTIVNVGDGDSPMFRVDWFINNVYQKKEGGQDWAPGLQRGASIDNFDAVWCDYKPKAGENKLYVMVVAQPARSIALEKFDEDNDLDGEIDINDKGTGPQIECQHHNAPIPTTEAE